MSKPSYPTTLYTLGHVWVEKEIADQLHAEVEGLKASVARLSNHINWQRDCINRATAALDGEET